MKELGNSVAVVPLGTGQSSMSDGLFAKRLVNDVSKSVVALKSAFNYECLPSLLKIYLRKPGGFDYDFLSLVLLDLPRAYRNMLRAADYASARNTLSNYINVSTHIERVDFPVVVDANVEERQHVVTDNSVTMSGLCSHQLLLKESVCVCASRSVPLAAVAAFFISHHWRAAKVV